MRELILLAVVVLAGAAVTLAARAAGGPVAVVGCVAGVLMLAQLVATLVVPGVRYRLWRYEVTNTDVLLRFGLLVVKRVVVPLVRVQHVETRQGPVLKASGLASVVVATAGDSFEIPGLSGPEADALRDRVAVLARIAQEDV